MKYYFHPDALLDFTGLVVYYAEIRTSLAELFVRAIEDGISKILDFPKSFQIIQDDIRRHYIDRFPIGIYYCVEEDSIVIYAVLHMSRDPDYWRHRVEKKSD